MAIQPKKSSHDYCNNVMEQLTTSFKEYTAANVTTPAIVTISYGGDMYTITIAKNKKVLGKRVFSCMDTMETIKRVEPVDRSLYATFGHNF